MVRKLILDTDPGGDDIFSILWLLSFLKHKNIDLLAITTAAGNVPARNTFNAACQILRLSEVDDIVVGRGVALPEQLFSHASHIHGSDGMGNLSQTLPPGRRRFADSPPSEKLIIDLLNRYPDEVTIVGIAPLTNLAIAENQSPGILKKAKEIVIMGGAFNVPGNVTPVAEFNIAFNVKAAQQVFASRSDMVMLPLDVTRDLVFTPEMIADLVADYPESKLVEFMARLVEFLTRTSLEHRETKGQRGFVIHDAVAIAYLFYPELLTFKRGQVMIETQGKFTTGQTLLDNRHGVKSGFNAWVATAVDGHNLMACLVQDLTSLIERVHYN